MATPDGTVLSKKTGRPLKPWAHERTGHLRVRLYAKHAKPKAAGKRKDGQPRTWFFDNVYVHVAIAMAFHGAAPSPTHQVLHLDDDPAHNRPENLRWGTATENAAHRWMDDEVQAVMAERERAEWLKGLDDDGFDWAVGDWVETGSRPSVELCVSA